MIDRQPINAGRVRRISGSFAFIEHRFLRQGFWTGLSHHALLLYVFLVLAADRQGLSFVTAYQTPVVPNPKTKSSAFRFIGSKAEYSSVVAAKGNFSNR